MHLCSLQKYGRHLLIENRAEGKKYQNNEDEVGWINVYDGENFVISDIGFSKKKNNFLINLLNMG